MANKVCAKNTEMDQIFKCTSLIAVTPNFVCDLSQEGAKNSW